MKKGKKILIITLSILIILVVAGFFIKNYVTDMVFTKVLETQIDSMLANGEISTEELETSENKPVSEIENDKQKNVNSGTGTQDQGSTEQTSSSSAGGSVNSSKAISKEEDKKLVKQKVQEIKKKTTASERSKVTKMVMAKLSSSDIAHLQGLAGDGISSEDINEAKKIAYSRFSASEIEILKNYYYQYMK